MKMLLARVYHIGVAINELLLNPILKALLQETKNVFINLNVNELVIAPLKMSLDSSNPQKSNCHKGGKRKTEEERKEAKVINNSSCFSIIIGGGRFAGGYSEYRNLSAT
uniref:Uncharacterized protein n=1 Tax=Salix viminalis TaxID=40686 RepID=A0A6N2LEP2_SALVM